MFEREDLPAVLGVLHGSILCNLELCIHFLDEEGNNLGLEDVTMVRVHLDKGLNQSLTLLRQALAVNALHDSQKVVAIDHALVDLLIILLQLGEHLVDFLFKSLLQAFEANFLNQSCNLLKQSWLTVDKLSHLLLSFVLLRLLGLLCCSCFL